LNLPSIQLVSGTPSAGLSNESGLNKVHYEQCTLDKALNEIIQSEPDNLYETVNRKLVLSAYAHCRHNQVQTARVLGISRNILRTLLKQFDVIQ